jgi:hypothetical protein
MLGGKRLLRWARRFAAGILTGFKGNQRRISGKRSAVRVFWHFSNRA